MFIFTRTPKDLTAEQRSEAYRFLTRELRTMHHTERTNLDACPALTDILRAVHEGRDLDAIEMSSHCITDAGKAWRLKQGIHYTTNGKARS
jgi:hypothetical protein